MKKVKFIEDFTFYENGCQKMEYEAGEEVEVSETCYRNAVALKAVEGSETAELVDLSELNATEFIDLVENCDDVESLKMYKKWEETNDSTPRKTVLKAIDEKLKELEAE